MRILVIPDIHEDLGFIEAIEVQEDFACFDHIVCLGDYFDPRVSSKANDQKLERVARKIKQWKIDLGSRLHLLCGNHDLPYYALRPDCVASKESANHRIGYAMSCTTLCRAKVINEIWDEPFWQELEGAALIDGVLFSHAGVHPAFWPEGESPQESYLQFSENWKRAFNSIYTEEMNPLFSIGKARRGDASFGGLLWMDWDKEFVDDLELPQIVGHTRWPSEPVIGKSRCVDMAQMSYGILENGVFTEKILPSKL